MIGWVLPAIPIANKIANLKLIYYCAGMTCNWKHRIMNEKITNITSNRSSCTGITCKPVLRQIDATEIKIHRYHLRYR